MTNRADPDQKPTDLDLHCLQRQGIFRFSRTRVNTKCQINYIKEALFSQKKNRMSFISILNDALRVNCYIVL